MHMQVVGASCLQVCSTKALKEGGGMGKESGGGKGVEMTQTLYAHMNKRNKKKERAKER
jgi:hypothetical protein